MQKEQEADYFTEILLGGTVERKPNKKKPLIIGGTVVVYASCRRVIVWFGWGSYNISHINKLKKAISKIPKLQRAKDYLGIVEAYNCNQPNLLTIIEKTFLVYIGKFPIVPPCVNSNFNLVEFD